MAAGPYFLRVLMQRGMRAALPHFWISITSMQSAMPSLIRCLARISMPARRIPLSNMMPLGAGVTIASWMAGSSGLISS